MSYVISSKVNDPAAVIDAYIKQLQTYISVTTIQLKRINEMHKKIGASWKGQQYQDFTVILENSISDAAKELKKLITISEKLKKSSAILRKATTNK